MPEYYLLSILLYLYQNFYLNLELILYLYKVKECF